jgi:hypothetical protein
MNSNRRTAVIVGILFIAATVSSSLSVVLFESILDAPDYLANIHPNRTQVIIGVLSLLVDCAAVVGIAFMLFPILKKYKESLALGYLGFRVIEATILIISNVIPLSLIMFSQEYVTAGAQDASRFQTLGGLLVAAHDWSFVLGIDIVFPLTALILNYLLYQSRLVPRFISVWGLIGGILWLAAGLLKIAGIDPGSIAALPIALQEMVFAIWLIVKGFSSWAIASEPAK